MIEAVRRAADGPSYTWEGQYRFRCYDGTYSVVLDRATYRISQKLSLNTNVELARCAVRHQLVD